MGDRGLRFLGLEHPVTTLGAVVVLHLGRVRSKGAGTTRLRQRWVALSAQLSLLLMGAVVPWPGLEHGRPLLRRVPEGAVQP